MQSEPQGGTRHRLEKNIAEVYNESEGDGTTTVALDASNDCSERLDGFATALELDAVCHHHHLY